MPVDECVEGEKDGRTVLAQVLGDMIWGELSDCLIQDCLVYSIPTNSNKLEQYVEVGCSPQNSCSAKSGKTASVVIVTGLPLILSVPCCPRRL